MYYNTIIANLNTTATVKKSDFNTVEEWEAYTSVMRKLQNTLVVWRNEPNDSNRNAFFNALKEFYSTINSVDGVKRENQYIPQSAEVEVARYGFISANVKTRKKHNADSLACEDNELIPAMREKMKLDLELVCKPEQTEAILPKLDKAKEAVANARKKCNALMDTYKQVEPMSEQAFRKGFETALAEAIVGKKMMTVAERNALQKATKEANNAKKKLLEAEVRVEVAKAE